MMSEYISIAVAHILDECNNGIERCCGSCNPSCGDLTRFICFGHNINEINEWISKNQDTLHREYQKIFE